MASARQAIAARPDWLPVPPQEDPTERERESVRGYRALSNGTLTASQRASTTQKKRRSTPWPRASFQERHESAEYSQLCNEAEGKSPSDLIGDD